MTNGIRTTWTSSLGNTYDLTLDADGNGIVTVKTAYRHRDGMQRTRAEGMEKFSAPLRLLPSLDDDTKERLARRIERQKGDA